MSVYMTYKARGRLTSELHGWEPKGIRIVSDEAALLTRQLLDLKDQEPAFPKFPRWWQTF